MFHKDLKIRSNNQIKTSEKKSWLKEILKQYPQVDETELKTLISVKDSEISYSKIVTHDNQDLIVYFSDKIPYFFKNEKDNQLIPTVYFLWRFPRMLANPFFTHKEVFRRLLNGADLMMPGLIVNEPVNLYTFKHIKKDQLVAICLEGNEAPIAIGKTYLSGEDMYMSGMKGKCVYILNIYEDTLWALGDKSLQVPLIIPVAVKKEIVKNEAETEQKTEGEKTVGAALETNQLEKDLEEKLTVIDENEEEKADEGVDHEKLLEECFLCAIKFRAKEFKLPIIISTFNATMMQTCSPTQYDLKKTRFKKISLFLKEMEAQGLIKMKELQKGVQSITDISKDNDKIKYFKRPDWFKEEMDAKKNSEEVKFVYNVIDFYKIDGLTDEFFKGKYKRGDVLTAAEIRQFTVNYVKEKGLQLAEKPKFLRLDDLLIKVFFKNKTDAVEIAFDELFQHMFAKISQMHQIKREPSMINAHQQLIKGKFQPIEFKLESRGGNKKVTCVYFLGPFELDPLTLQTKIKKILGCSVTLNEANAGGSSNTTAAIPNDYVVCVQGNQIFQVSEILKTKK